MDRAGEVESTPLKKRTLQFIGWLMAPVRATDNALFFWEFCTGTGQTSDLVGATLITFFLQHRLWEPFVLGGTWGYQLAQ